MGRHKRKRSGNSESESSSKEDSSSDSDTSSSSSSPSDASDTKSSVKVRSKKKHKKRKEQQSRKKLNKKRKSSELITKHDFFEKSSEFRLWLIEKRQQYFDELSNADSRKLFKKFAVRWNSGKLNKKYYEGIPVSELQKTVRTRYKWKFASKLDDFEQDTVRDSVIVCTAGNSKVENFSTSKPTAEKSQVRGPIGPTMPSSVNLKLGSAAVLAQEQKQLTDQQRRKYEDKKYREKKNVVMDELLPKATGREARIEKKFAETERQRQREQSPETREEVLMGGGDDLRSRLAAKHRFQARRREEKQQQVADKVEHYEAKEKAKMDALLAMAHASKKENALWQPK